MIREAAFLARCPDCKTMVHVTDLFADHECPNCAARIRLKVNSALNPLVAEGLRMAED